MPDRQAAEQRRQGEIRAFLDRAGWAQAAMAPLADDCSFRRYFRLRDGAGAGALVLMDAPPDKEEIAPFVGIAELLLSGGFSVPRIFARDDEHGFLLIEDFGDTTYTRALAGGADEAALYRLATDLLVELHRRPLAPAMAELPAYGDAMLLDEAALFVDWYLVRGLGLAVPAGSRAAYLDAWYDCLPIARGAPDVLVLRDYHVDNMMVLPGRPGIGACGLLDFQDAVIGPASYDLVSLLQDSRRDIAEDLVQAMLTRYAAGHGGIADREAFHRSYLALGAQRALKVLGIFTRQSLLHGNHQYLRHVPRLWRHVEADLSIPELAPVREWIDRVAPAELRRVPAPGGPE